MQLIDLCTMYFNLYLNSHQLSTNKHLSQLIQRLVFDSAFDSASYSVTDSASDLATQRFQQYFSDSDFQFSFNLPHFVSRKLPRGWMKRNLLIFIKGLFGRWLHVHWRRWDVQSLSFGINVWWWWLWTNMMKSQQPRLSTDSLWPALSSPDSA